MKPFAKKSFGQKQYLVILISLLLVFILYHAVVYLFITSKVINIAPPYSVGDLSRMGYQTGSNNLRKLNITLSKTHLEGSQYKQQPIDMLTIGDSFSNGGGGGTNPFYQDYLATYYGYTVLNIRPLPEYKEGFLETIIALINSGTLDEIKPKAILLEFGNRSIFDRFNKRFEWDLTLPKNQIISDISQMKRNNVADSIPKDIFFINESNYKTLINTVKFRYKPCLSNGVCRLPLKQDFFTVKESHILEFYKDEITYLSQVDQKSVSNINNNFNHIAELLRAKGIAFYVMPIVDKHDLYQPYLQNDPYGANPLFDYLRPLEKRYTLIDTKAILSKELDKGRKDIFFADDTHWSNLAAETVMKEASFHNLRGH